MEKNIKAIIVDDEIGACENLKAILAKHCADIDIVTHAQNTRDAEQLILQNKPDLVFLDIEMPNESGIEFIKRIWPINFEIVFVTAYDQYAIKTFRLNALDYILKPINIDYLLESLTRIKDIINLKRLSTSTVSNTDLRLTTYTESEDEQHIILRDNGTYTKVPFKDILYLKADGSYSSFVIQEKNNFKTILTTYNLAYYEELLSDTFIRCHRSFLVNIDKVVSLNTNVTEKKLIFPDNEMIPISRRRLAAIKTALR